LKNDVNVHYLQKVKNKNLKTISKLSGKCSGMFFPDPDPDFSQSRIQGSKKAADPGSATLRDPVPLKGLSHEKCVQAGGDQVLLSSVKSSLLRCLSDPLALIRQSL
jgi:hypothetical protein